MRVRVGVCVHEGRRGFFWGGGGWVRISCNFMTINIADVLT